MQSMNTINLLNSNGFFVFTNNCIDDLYKLLLLSQGQELIDNLDCLFSLDDCRQRSCESTMSNASFQTIVGVYWYVKGREASERKVGDSMYFHFSRLKPLSYT